MSNKTRGLYNKFLVTRRDGRNIKHHQCDYFVLDVTHDPHAKIALQAYAASCQADYPLLAADLRSRWLTPDGAEVKGE